MTEPPKWQSARAPSETKRRLKSRLGYMAACLVLYAIVMSGVRFYAHSIGIAGGLLTIVAMYGAARWYDHRQKKTEISPEKERSAGRLS